MKTKLALAVSAITLFFSSCGHKSSANKIEGSEAQTAVEGGSHKLAVDTATSVVNWKGFKPGGSHHGVLSLKSGELFIEGDSLISGSFILDMNSINNGDLTSATGKGQLEGHLKSADFFDVAQYPEGKFVITKVEPLAGSEQTHRISGNLTLKNVEKNITFDAVITKDGDTYQAVTAPFVIDRTQWGVNYQSKNIFKDLKDSFINDEIEVSITIRAHDA